MLKGFFSVVPFQAEERKKKPGLVFIPFSDENDPAKVSKRSPRRKNVSDLSPNECSTPVTPNQPDQRSDRIISTEADYPVNQNRIGSNTIIEADRYDKETFLIEKRFPNSDLTGVDYASPNQDSDSVFIGGPDLVEMNGTRVKEPANISVELDVKTSELDHVIEPGRASRNLIDSVPVSAENKRTHRTAWAQPQMIDPAQFFPVEDSRASAVSDSDPDHNKQPVALEYQLEHATTVTQNQTRFSPRQTDEFMPPDNTKPGTGWVESPEKQFTARHAEIPVERGVAIVIPAEEPNSPPEEGNMAHAREDLEIGVTVRVYEIIIYVLMRIG